MVVNITVIINTIITCLPEKISAGFSESYLEDVPAGVAPRGKLRVVAGSAVDAVRLRPKLLVHQAPAAL